MKKLLFLISLIFISFVLIACQEDGDEIDLDKPVITGAINIEYVIGDPTPNYLDGVTAFDEKDGNITHLLIVDELLIDLLNVGDYQLIYEVTNSIGNKDTKTVVVTVRLQVSDIVNSPVISGYKDIIHTYGNQAPDYLDGLSAIDIEDGDLTDMILVDDSLVDLMTIGMYTLTYSVLDQDQHNTSVTINVTVVDTTSPVISGLTDMTYHIGDPLPNFGDFGTAIDNYDGDISDQISIDSRAFDDWIIGSYEVFYSVTDSSNNTTTVSITIEVIDVTPPTLLNTKDFVVALDSDQPDYLDGVIAFDTYDGLLTDYIIVDDSLLNLSQVGIYDVFISVSDLSGNTTTNKIRVFVLDKTAPIIYGTQNYTHLVGDIAPELLEGVTSIDNVDGDITESIVLLIGTLDFEVPGLYIITYESTDSQGNLARVQVTVTVIDPNQPDTINNLNIFYINDTHGAILENGQEMGMAKIGNLVLAERAANPLSTLFVGGGDLLQGTLVSNYFYGASMIDSLNYIGLDAFVLGNHEFDWGIEIVTNYRDPANPLMNAEFPLLGANIFFEGTETRPEYIDAYTIVQKGNIKVGIIGLMGFGLESSIASSRVNGYTFANPTYWAAYYTEHLRVNENVDVVIVITHDDGRSNGFNQNVSSWTGNQRVDAVFNGHSHQDYGDLINRSGVNMPAVQASSNGRKVGKVTFTFNESGVLTNAAAITLNGSNESRLNTAHPGLSQLINSYVEQIEPLLNDVIIYSGQSASQSQLTYYMAKLIRLSTDADIGFHNLGGTRASLSNGQAITVATLYQIFPFDNRVKTTYLLGSQILQYISSYGGYNDQKPGVTFESNQYYKVATNDYIFDQPDNPFINGNNSEDTGILIRDLLETVLRNQADAGLTFSINNPIVLFGNNQDNLYYVGYKKEVDERYLSV